MCSSDLYFLPFAPGASYPDPWVYWGTAELPSYSATHFSDTYYFRRWTLTVPNFIFQNFLGPFEAQLVQRNLILILLLSLVGALTYLLSKSLAATFTSMLVVSSTNPLIAAVGQSYHEGTGLILFISLAITMHVLVQQENPTRHLALCAGLLFGLLFVTYQFTVYIFVGMVLGALACRGTKGMVNFAKYFSVPFLLGFLIVDTIDFLIGLWFGSWPELLTFSFFMNEQIRQSGQFAPDIPEFLERTLASSNNFMIGIAVAGLAMLIGGKVRTRWFSFLLLFVALMYSLLPFTGTHVHQLHTVVYGLMLSILAGIVWLSQALDDLQDNHHHTRIGPPLKLLLMTTVVIACTFFPEGFWVWATLVAIAASLIGLLLLRKKAKRARHSPSRLLLLGSAGATALALLSPGLSIGLISIEAFYSKLSNAKHGIESLSHEVRTLGSFAEENRYRIFILDNREHEGWSETISAFYGQYSSIAEGYPPPALDCSRLAYAQSQPNARLILLDENSRDSAIGFIKSYLSRCSGSTHSFEGKLEAIDAYVFSIQP